MDRLLSCCLSPATAHRAGGVPCEPAAGGQNSRKAVVQRLQIAPRPPLYIQFRTGNWGWLMRRISAVSLALFMLPAASFLFCGVTAGAVEYRFTNITDTTTGAPGDFAFTAFAELAISGDNVAFLGFYSGGAGIFRGSGESLTTIVLSGDPGPVGAPGIYSNPTINGDLVAFSGAYGDLLQTSGIFAGSGGPITTLVLERDPSPGGAFVAFGPPAVSGAIVAFRGIQRTGIGGVLQTGIFTSSTGTGEAVTTIANQGDIGPAGPLHGFFDPKISDDAVVFLARHEDDSQGIYKGSGGPLTKIVNVGDPAPFGVFHDVSFPSISGDMVAFHGADDEGTGIFAQTSDGMLTTVVRRFDPAPSGVFLTLFPAAAATGGVVAFLAEYGEVDEEAGLTIHGSGVFAASEGSLSTVIKMGDPLFGSFLVSFASSEHDVPYMASDPDRGRSIAFTYALEDGRRGVAMATIIPEPTSFFLGAIWLSSFWFTARVRRQCSHFKVVV
jgi:hypothetical protein